MKLVGLVVKAGCEKAMDVIAVFDERKGQLMTNSEKMVELKDRQHEPLLQWSAERSYCKAKKS